jgi:hypothetical protein
VWLFELGIEDEEGGGEGYHISGFATSGRLREEDLTHVSGIHGRDRFLNDGDICSVWKQEAIIIVFQVCKIGQRSEKRRCYHAISKEKKRTESPQRERRYSKEKAAITKHCKRGKVWYN